MFLPHYSSGVLTPTASNFMNLNGNLEKFNSDFKPKFLSFIMERKLGHIIMVDFVDCEFIKTVINFNTL